MIPLLASASTHSYPGWSVVPFVLLLLSIAILPLVASHWWHSNRNKALVAALMGVPVALYVAFVSPASLAHTGLEYLAFCSLIGSLYVIAGGVELQGRLPGNSWAVAGVLAAGAVLANLVGTTGASMLLIRPLLRAVDGRKDRSHIVVFFIFIVSNCGGLLTPLGDPPLFLGFLQGVPFTWTLNLWKEWAIANGILISVFLVVDTARVRREAAPPPPVADAGRLRLRGVSNLALLACVVGAIIGGGALAPRWGASTAQLAQAFALIFLAAASLAITPREIRKANDFSWHPFLEVVFLFAGIFAAMIPALGVLQEKGPSLPVREPWQFFWATGMLSGFLDNAPTYLAFVSIASFLPDEIIGTTYAALTAISCGAVFFGALTYIGNGPNFMVKAIAEHSGVRMPSFFGYLAWSVTILLPIYVLLTFLFFR
ncbi:MAG: sodium:proton antiporter [Candidatus Brocadiae bacterium]|nr:sodium:proton antiporter [Candidatus Brocadiia bacterium]